MQVVILIIVCIWSIAITIFAIFYRTKESEKENETKEQRKKENEKNTKQASEIKKANAELGTKPNAIGFNNALKLLRDYATRDGNQLPPNGSKPL